MTKLTSRKFWFAVVSALCALFLMITGNITPDLGVKIILAAAGVFLGAEGLVDFAKALKK
jgi:hypothetical protein